MLPYLKLCAASIRDQDLSYEHVIADGGSTDGTKEWLIENPDIVSVSEKDSGMYNALNKAIGMAHGEIIGHLNCDEQYLPGTLKIVVDFFNAHQEIDFIAADFLIVDNQGNFVAYRKSFQPRWQYFFSNYLYTTTCTLFYRKKIFNVCKFNESYRSIADVIFLYEVIRGGFKGAHLKKYFSTFTYSGNNLSLQPISALEKAKFKKTLPLWYRLFKPVFFVMFFFERIVGGIFTEKSPLTYSIFTTRSPSKREMFTKVNPDFRLEFKLFESGRE